MGFLLVFCLFVFFRLGLFIFFFFWGLLFCYLVFFLRVLIHVCSFLVVWVLCSLVLFHFLVSLVCWFLLCVDAVSFGVPCYRVFFLFVRFFGLMGVCVAVGGVCVPGLWCCFFVGWRGDQLGVVGFGRRYVGGGGCAFGLARPILISVVGWSGVQCFFGGTWVQGRLRAAVGFGGGCVGVGGCPDVSVCSVLRFARGVCVLDCG